MARNLEGEKTKEIETKPEETNLDPSNNNKTKIKKNKPEETNLDLPKEKTKEQETDIEVHKDQKAPLKVRFNDVTKDNVGQLRLLDISIFPVRYNDKFYKNVVDEEDVELCRLVYHSDVLIGAVCCRIEDTKSEEDETSNPDTNANGQKKKSKELEAPDIEYKRCYIMTLGVLKAYRKYSVGRKMLQHVIDLVEKRDNLNEIFLHVQVSNKIAIAFYEKFGFKIIKRMPNYYKRIDPPDCFLVSRKFDRSPVGGNSKDKSVD